MTIGTLWLALIVLVPIVVLFLLRVNAAIVFLSLCLGYVLLAFDATNANQLASGHAYLKSSGITVNLALLLGPALLTILFQLKTINEHKKLINLIPSLAVGLVLPLLIMPLLPLNLRDSIAASTYWRQLSHYGTVIVGVGALVAIAFFWLNSRTDGSKKHSKAKQ